MGRCAIVLAAGLGTRMKSKRHKVLHNVCGKPMIIHILDELDELGLDQVIVVVGQQREQVQAAVAGRAEIAVQEEQLGTGHAVQAAMPLLKPEIDSVVVLYGDAPLIRARTMTEMFETRLAKQASAVILTATVPNPFGLGRVFLNDDGSVVRVVEEKDATDTERAVRLVNTGIYAFDKFALLEALNRLRPDNAQGEYYLTDTVAGLRNLGQAVYPYEVADYEETASVNDRVQLAQVEAILRRRLCEHWMRQGVTIVDPNSTYISPTVDIGRDTTLLPGTFLGGTTRIGEDCVIGPNSRLVNTTISDGVSVEYSVILDSTIDSEAHVGPFAYIRPGSHVGRRVKIGDFVELKNTTVGDDSKVSHLAYLGDADVGRDVNIGCGVITVNYDGKQKHRTTVGDGSFVGSNANLIAPLQIGSGAYITAGSTITDEVPADGFAIARVRQVTKPDYVRAWKDRRERK